MKQNKELEEVKKKNITLANEIIKLTDKLEQGKTNKYVDPLDKGTTEADLVVSPAESEVEMEIDTTDKTSKDPVKKKPSFADIVKGSDPSPSQSLKCLVCDKVFNTNEELKHHENKTHRDDGDWCCVDCDYQTNSMSKLVNHVNAAKHIGNF